MLTVDDLCNVSVNRSKIYDGYTLTETTTLRSLSANLTSSTLKEPPPDMSIEPFLMDEPAETFMERTTSEIFVTNLAEYVTVCSTSQ